MVDTRTSVDILHFHMVTNFLFFISLYTCFESDLFAENHQMKDELD